LESERLNGKALTGCALSCLLILPAQVYCQQNLEQETISIRGNRGLPKTVYIAPWKRLGEPLEGERLESQVSDPLAPLEQDLFLRQLEIHRGLQDPPAR
jgi:hypothetical protein